MKTLKLDKAWSYVTPIKTIDYPAGSHEVTNEIHDAAVSAGVTKGEADGNGLAKTGAKGAADKTEG